MKSTSGLFFSSHLTQRDGSLPSQSQNNQTQDFQSSIQDYSLNNLSQSYDVRLNTSISKYVSLFQSREEADLFITHRFGSELLMFATDAEKLNYISNLSSHKINSMVKVIITRINFSPYVTIRKINAVKIAELIILARKFTSLKNLAKRIKISPESISLKLLSLGLQWDDLVTMNPEPIIKLSDLCTPDQNYTSCLNKSIEFLTFKRIDNFDWKKSFPELITKLKSKRTIRIIAREFGLHDDFLMKNYSLVIEFLTDNYLLSPDIIEALEACTSLGQVRKIMHKVSLCEKQTETVSENDELLFEALDLLFNEESEDDDELLFEAFNLLSNEESADDDESLYEAFNVLFNEADEDQLIDKLIEEIHIDATGSYHNDDNFDILASSVAQNLQESFQNENDVTGQNEIFNESLLCKDNEYITKHSCHTSSSANGVFADKAISPPEKERSDLFLIL